MISCVSRGTLISQRVKPKNNSLHYSVTTAITQRQKSDLQPLKSLWLLNGKQIVEAGVERDGTARVLPWSMRKMVAVYRNGSTDEVKMVGR